MKVKATAESYFSSLQCIPLFKVPAFYLATSMASSSYESIETCVPDWSCPRLA